MNNLYIRIYVGIIMIIAALVSSLLLFPMPPKPVTATLGQFLHFTNSISIGIPKSYHGLEVFPIMYNGSQEQLIFITLEDAQKQNLVEITELSSPSVNTVRIKNKAKVPLFLLNGEMINGAKQTRMITNDTLIPATSDWVEVSVYCVEHGRWTNGAKEFEVTGYIVPNDVRQESKNTKNQSSVWSAVRSKQDKNNVSSSTDSLKDLLDDKEIQKRFDEYSKGLGDVYNLHNTVGYVATINGNVVAIDIFHDSDMFQKYAEKLLHSYIYNAIDTEVKTQSTPIDYIWTTLNEISYGTTLKSDLLAQYTTSNGVGSYLVQSGEVVHIDWMLKTSTPVTNTEDRINNQINTR